MSMFIVSMSRSSIARRALFCAGLTATWLSASTVDATVARIQTSMGNIDFRLYETATPITVANFLNYMNSDRYDGTYIHRSIPGFVVQGGGYTYDPQSGVSHIPQFDQIINEPGISNLRGTIAMAKLPPPPQGPANGGPDSATSEWFFNLTDNSGPPPALDTQNGGFTVFGRIVHIGLTTIDAIAALPTTSGDVPLQGNADDAIEDRLVYVNSVFLRTSIPPADYNFDAQVTLDDYNIWRSTFGSTTNAAADGNGNGVVDAADFVMWRDAYVAAGGSVVGIVPEPSSVVLLLVSGALMTSLRPRRC
jgi:peptidyl-prolyl cis-trans isomerase A (cyclophilin A)